MPGIRRSLLHAGDREPRRPVLLRCWAGSMLLKISKRTSYMPANGSSSFDYYRHCYFASGDISCRRPKLSPRRDMPEAVRYRDVMSILLTAVISRFTLKRPDAAIGHRLRRGAVARIKIFLAFSFAMPVSRITSKVIIAARLCRLRH